MPVALRSSHGPSALMMASAPWDGALHCVAVGELAGDHREVGVGDGELGRVAEVGGDVVAGVEGPGDDLAADAAGGA
jgi:hypothetical protein